MPQLPSLASTTTTAQSTWKIVLALGIVVTMACTGCTGLPKDVKRDVSKALAVPASTALGQMVATRRAAEGTKHLSGFMLLNGPQAAYSSRLALVEAAQKTLDLQYYAIHADASTERLLRSVAAAAQRGVRVRVLLDDFHSAGRDAQVMRLAFAPNVEMRMFNPIAGARGSAIGRMFSLLADFDRLQQRMHNKLFIGDNAMGIMGGRNLGDAYFGTADTGNFLDLDVLAAGPIVQDLSRSFDSYWNNERAYPVQSLITRAELDTMQATTQAADAAKRQSDLGQGAANSTLNGTQTPSAADPDHQRTAPAEQRARIWDYQPMDLAQARFTWAPAAVLVDQPAKIPADGVSATHPLPETPPARATPLAITSALGAAPPAKAATDLRAATQPSPALRAATGSEGSVAASGSGAFVATAVATAPLPAPTPFALLAPSATTAADNETLEAQTDTVVDGLLQLISQAQRDLLIISPYFVPGPDMMRAFATARARGVRVRILTNSLASNDAPIAHAGYARHRPQLLAMGVQMYEMRSELTGRLRTSLRATGSSGATGSTGDSRAMLHSKVLVMDGRLLVVGSMNLDIRSQRQNTEIALLIRSAPLAKRATTQIEETLHESAWHVEQTDHGLLWRAPPNSGLSDTRTEPDASIPLRLMLQLLGPLAPDHLL